MSRRLLGFVLVLALALGTARAADGPSDETVVATVDGAAITAGEVRVVMRGFGRSGGEGDRGPEKALERIVETQLLAGEGRRRGYWDEPSLVAGRGMARQGATLQEYVRLVRGAEIEAGDDDARAFMEGRIHGGSDMSADQWADVIFSRRLKDAVQREIRQAAAGIQIDYLPDAYQEPNTSGFPTGDLVVARAAGREITWVQVARAMGPKGAALSPPLSGPIALKFVSAISTALGTALVLEKAREREAEIGAAVEKTVSAYGEALVVGKVMQSLEKGIEVTGAEVRAWFEDHPERYRADDGTPHAFEVIEKNVRLDLMKEKRESARGELVGDLRRKAKIIVDKEVLQGLQ